MKSPYNPFPCAGGRVLHAPTRRQFLYSLGASLGSVAFSSLMAEQEKSSLGTSPHVPAKATNVIFLMMEGGRRLQGGSHDRRNR